MSITDNLADFDRTSITANLTSFKKETTIDRKALNFEFCFDTRPRMGAYLIIVHKIR